MQLDTPSIWSRRAAWRVGLPSFTLRPRLLLTGAALLVALLMLLPLLYLLMRAVGADGRAWGVLLRPRTLEVALGSVGLALGAALGSALLAVPLGWLTVCSDLPGRRVWTVLTLLPLVVPSYITAFAFIAVLGPKGMLQGWLAPLGVERLPPIYGFWGALLTLTLCAYPYVLLNVRATLLRCDPALEEAARSLGERPLTVFWRITLPQLRPAIGAGGLLVALYTLSDFGAVSLLQFNSFTRAIYMQYRASFSREGAALLALLLVAVTVLLVAAELLVRGRARLARSNCAVARQRRPAPLGRWRLPALLFCAAVVLVALGIPLLALTYWLVRGVVNGQELVPVGQLAANSLLASGLASLLALAAALPVAVLAVRFPGPLSRLIERSVYLGYALPGIVVALALVFFGATYAPALYQTLPMLLLAYVVRFLPEAVGGVRTSLLQINPRLEDAARSLGSTPAQTLRRVTGPLLAPGLLAGGALVFLTAMKELPTTLLLGPAGFGTLATSIWTSTAEAFFARASAPALLLLAISALGLWVLMRQEQR